MPSATKKVKLKVLVIQTCVTLRFQAPQPARFVPLSMEFSSQEYWSRLPFPSPGDLPNPGIKPRSPALQEVSLPSEPAGKLSTTKPKQKNRSNTVQIK